MRTARTEEILACVEDLRRGDLSARVAESGDDEALLAAFVSSVNALAEQLQLRHGAYLLATRMRDQSVAALDAEAADLGRRCQRDGEAMRRMGLPILAVWDKPRILCAVVLGIFDSERCAALTESLLGQVATQRARWAVVDLSTIETVDHGVAARVAGLGRALRLIGARAVLTGVRPGVAAVAANLDLGSAWDFRASVAVALSWILGARPGMGARLSDRRIGASGTA